MYASFEKDENVVNPPHIPTVKKRRHSDDIINPFSKMPRKIPMRKHPAILIIRVPQGNTVSKLSWKYFDTRNRRIVPMKPPKPAKSIDLTIKSKIKNDGRSHQLKEQFKADFIA